MAAPIEDARQNRYEKLRCQASRFAENVLIRRAVRMASRSEKQSVRHWMDTEDWRKEETIRLPGEGLPIPLLRSRTRCGVEARPGDSPRRPGSRYMGSIQTGWLSDGKYMYWRVSIPPWFDSNSGKGYNCLCQSAVSIPPWFDSNKVG